MALRNWLSAVGILLALGVISSCASSGSVNKSKAFRTAKPDLLLHSLANGQPQYTWYAAKGRIRASTEDMRVGGTINLRMQKDSSIWILAEKLGFEVFRALITPDSVYALDRLNKMAITTTFERFTKEYNAPFTFTDLQTLLAGGTILFEPTYSVAERVDDKVRLTVSNEIFKALYWFGESLLLDKGTLLDESGRSVEVEYGDYRTVGNVDAMPFQRHIAINDGYSRTEALLQFSQIELDVPKSMRFEIPYHYLKVD